jgi:hypothetical protein
MSSDQSPDTDSHGEAWTLVPQTPEEADTIARLIRAGVSPREVCRDPEHGILLSHVAVRALADTRRTGRRRPAS